MSKPGPAHKVSARSDFSKGFQIDFKKGQTGSSSQLGSVSQFEEDSHMGEEDPSVPIGQESQAEVDAIFQDVKKRVLSFVEQQLERLHMLLAPDHPKHSESEEEASKEVLTITMDILKEMDQELLAQRLSSRTTVGFRDKLKSDLQQRFNQRFSHVFEGVAKAADSVPLNQIYTELYITEGGTSEINQEHEVRHMETVSRRPATPETITCEVMFKTMPHSSGPNRVVLTKGVAGVGKTVLTQKFSLDWAEGRAHQDLKLLFPFTFRELNVLRDTQFSLVGLLHHFFGPSKDLCSFQHQMLFIFDGLDECRPSLDFTQAQHLTDPTEITSVHVLLVNLIRGSLLPYARLWITTRPAAANQIPAEYIFMVTEVQGFTDTQKEQYFRKMFRDEANKIISHIKMSRTLHIMCYIPVFCWILSTVLKKLLEQTERPELPQTLTQMYAHLLTVQAKVQNIKYHQGSGTDIHWTPEIREMVWSLGKVAFEQLQKGNLIFYECDLEDSDIDLTAASVYSGVFTQVFKEEKGLYQEKVYCFIHLSVQEFLAALHVHHTFFSSGENLLKPPQSGLKRKRKRKNTLTQETTKALDLEAAFYCSAVDQALQSQNGHLDLFLRFLLGLSLSTNQKLLQGLLTPSGSDQANEETVKYIKQKLNEKGLSTERGLNLFHCLNEMNDRSLEEIQKNMRKYLSDRKMSPAQWSALSFLLLSSDSDLEEFDLRKYQASEKALLGLLPVVRASTKALLCGCGLSPYSCGPLVSVLSSSSLTHLDLSHNDLQDLGVEELSSGLKSAPCRLETLRLSGCLLSERGGAALASALGSTPPSHLRVLDLSYNHLGPSAKLLTALQDHRPRLCVRTEPSGERWMVPGLRKYSQEFSLDPDTAHRHVLLCENNRTAIHVKEEQQYPDHKDRFTDYYQVLSCTGLKERWYWEVHWRGQDVEIAMSYSGIKRSGRGLECGFGNNDQSWSLEIYDEEYYVCHNNNATRLHRSHSSERVGVSPGKGDVSSGRVGVFLDYEAKALSFYEVSSDGELFHLWTFSSSFSEPLFPGFELGREGSSVTLVKEMRQ